jgi:membrane protein YdbS with pleckstrin-like domain
MPFPRDLLNVDEDVVLDIHPHWLFFAEPVLSGLVLLALTIVLAVTVGNAGLTLFLLVLVAAVLIWGLWRLATWRSTHFVITTDRLVYRAGVFAKRGIQIPLERVNNVNFKQGLLERIVGAGDLLVESAGEDGQQRFTDVRHPDQIQNIIHAEMNANERRTQGTPGPVDRASQLEKLEGMLQRSTLTRDEFEAEKRRILGEAPAGSPSSAAESPPQSPGRGGSAGSSESSGSAGSSESSGSAGSSESSGSAASSGMLPPPQPGAGR